MRGDAGGGEWGGEWGALPGDGPARAAKTLTEETLARLRRDIVAGAFEAGGKVKSDDLKRRYGVGTSPVREALFQLVSEGLVRADGQRGFRVAALSAEELADIADWRARLECEALRRSIHRGDVEWEAGVVAALHRLRRVEARADLEPGEAAELWEERHRGFHFALYSACGSPWLLRFCGLLIRHGERYRRAYVAYPRVEPSITGEHEALAAAATGRDDERAAALLEAHIRHAAGLAQAHATDGARDRAEERPVAAGRGAASRAKAASKPGATGPRLRR